MRRSIFLATICALHSIKGSLSSRFTSHSHDLAFTSNSHAAAAAAAAAAADRLPSSPECWISAMTSLDFPVGDASHVCSTMLAEDQKRFALALARCQLEDLGRPLFQQADSSANPQLSCEKPVLSRQETSVCLKSLTEAGMQTYTHFISYVNQLCTRLIQEVAMNYFEASSHRLAHASNEARIQLDTLQREQDLLHQSWTSQHQDLLQMQHAFSKNLNDQTDGLANRVQELQIELSNTHAKLQQQQTKALEEQSLKMDKLSQAMTNTQDTVLPWLTIIQTWALRAQKNFSVIRMMVTFIGWVILIYILPLGSRHRRIRRRLLATLVASLLLDVAVDYCDCGTLKIGEWQVQEIISRSALFLALVMYLNGAFKSIFIRDEVESDEGINLSDEARELAQRLQAMKELQWMSAMRLLAFSNSPDTNTSMQGLEGGPPRPPPFWTVGDSVQQNGTYYEEVPQQNRRVRSNKNQPSTPSMEPFWHTQHIPTVPSTSLQFHAFRAQQQQRHKMHGSEDHFDHEPTLSQEEQAKTNAMPAWANIPFFGRRRTEDCDEQQRSYANTPPSPTTTDSANAQTTFRASYNAPNFSDSASMKNDPTSSHSSANSAGQQSNNQSSAPHVPNRPPNEGTRENDSTTTDMQTETIDTIPDDSEILQDSHMGDVESYGNQEADNCSRKRHSCTNVESDLPDRTLGKRRKK